MTNLYFVYSPAAAAAAAPIMRLDTGAVPPIQNTIKVCDARDGSAYVATVVYDDEQAMLDKYQIPLGQVVAVIPSNKAIWIEYTTGRAGDVEWQMNNKGLSPKERENVRRCIATECAK